MSEDNAASNEHMAQQLRTLSPHLATLRSCARKVLSECECSGTGKIRKQRGFFTKEVECVKCIPIRQALATGEIV